MGPTRHAALPRSAAAVQVKIVVVGAGMGGLTAALRLQRLGHQVVVLEARAEPGGLASSFDVGGFQFDAGPYILLDRAGLEWALGEVGIPAAERPTLIRLDHVYRVGFPDGTELDFHHDLAATAEGFERRWKGAGVSYTRFVRETQRIHGRLQPLLTRPHSLAALVRTGAWRNAGFLLRSLGAVLARSGLPQPLIDALAIWTHVAGQDLAHAPSPLGLVPGLIHGVGAWYPEAGIGAIPRLVAAAALAAGVELRTGTRVRAILEQRGRSAGVETDAGECIPADAVLSNYSAIGTQIEMVASTPPAARAALTRLPLQSPGSCLYLALKGAASPPYLRFFLPGGGERCRLLVQPGVVVPRLVRGEEHPARLIAPMDHARSKEAGAEGQARFVARLLDEPWWRDGIESVRVLAARTPRDWGSEHHLYDDSMNPVMTARLMRAGRLPHRSRHQRGLYFAGSSTHPGQWVSFAAISGVLAADRLHQDLA